MAGAVIAILKKVVISYAISKIGNKLFGPKKSTSPTYAVGALQTQTDSSMVMSIIYGCVKCAGNNLWQSGKGKTVKRLVGFGVGKNHSVSDVRLNNIPIGEVTLISIQNTKYPDAYVRIGKVPDWDSGLYCYSSGDAFSLDTQSGVTIQSIVDSINKHSPYGWKASTTVGDIGSDKIPKTDLAPCYDQPYMPTKTILTDCSYSAYMGDGEQEIDSRVTGETQIDKAKVVGGMKYDAYLAMTITASDSLSGSPNVTAVWEGREVWVWDSLAVYHNEYTTNPAWCILDFMTSIDGCNIPIDDIDIQSFITAAAYFQPGDGSRHWELNLILDEKKSRQDWLNEMLLTCRSWRTYQRGKHGILVDKPEPVSQIFTVAKDENIQHNWSEMSDDYERIIIKYPDPDYEWTQVGAPATIKAPFHNATYNADGTVKSNGTPLSKTIEINGITNFKQASQQAWFGLNKAQTCQDTIIYTCNKRALNRTIGDVVGMKDPILQLTEAGLDYKRYRIMAMTEPQGVQIQMAMEEYNEALYTDAQGSAAPVVTTTKLPNPAQPPANVTNITADEHFRDQGNGVILVDLHVSFTPPDTQFYSHTEAYVKTNLPAVDEINVPVSELTVAPDRIGDVLSNWKYIDKAVDNLLIQNVIVGQDISIKLVSVSKNGLKANFDSAPVYTRSVAGKTYLPATPTGFGVNITDKCEWYWNPHPDKDADYLELRTDTNVGNPIGLLAKTLSTKATVTPPSRTGTAYLFAHNTANKWSAPVVYVWQKAAPVAPANVKITDVFQGLVIGCDALPVYALGINVHINDGTGEKVYFSQNNSYNFKTTGGTFDIQVAYVDLFGEGALSDAVTRTVSATVDPALLAAESLSLEKMDSTIKAAVKKANEAATQLSVDQVNTAINDAKTRLSTVEGTASTNSAAITSLNTEIDLKAAQLTVDAIAGRVTTAEGNISTQAGQIALKANQTTVDTLANTVSSNKSELDVTINGITQTVTSNKTTQDGVNQNLVTQINTQAGQITQITSDVNGAYSAISQNTADIQLRATKDDVNALINISSSGVITVKSELLHITAQTLIDGNLIATGMIQAGAVTAEKVDASVLNLTANGKTLSAGNTSLNQYGMTVTDSSGNHVMFDNRGITFTQADGQAYGFIRKFVVGEVDAGKYVRLDWSKTPIVLLSPKQVRTYQDNYENANIDIQCYADQVTPAGFRAILKTVQSSGTTTTSPLFYFTSPTSSDYTVSLTNVTSCSATLKTGYTGDGWWDLVKFEFYYKASSDSTYTLSASFYQSRRDVINVPGTFYARESNRTIGVFADKALGNYDVLVRCYPCQYTKCVRTQSGDTGGTYTYYAYGTYHSTVNDSETVYTPTETKTYARMSSYSVDNMAPISAVGKITFMAVEMGDGNNTGYTIED